MRKTAAMLISLAVIFAAGCGSQDNSSLSQIVTDPAASEQSADSSQESSSEGDSSSDVSSGSDNEDKTEGCTAELKTKADIFYSGKEICPEVTVLNSDGSELAQDAYELSYRDNLKPGTAYVDIKIKESARELSLEFEIKPLPLSAEGVDAAAEAQVLDYTGKEQEQKIIVKNPVGDVLEQDRDYTVSYENAKGPGTVTVKVTGQGFYTGEIEVSYVIKPQAVSGVKLDKSAERSVTLSWDKCAGAQGYQVCLKNDSGYTVLADINTGECAAEINGLEPDTAYTFYVRPYLNSEGTTYYSDSEGFKAATLKGAPDKVMISEAAASDKGITLKWQAVKNAEQYRVQRAEGSEWKQVGVMTGCSFTDDDVSAGTKYRYRVRAERKDGDKTLAGEYSEEKSVTAAEKNDDSEASSGSVESAAGDVKIYYFSAAEKVYDTKGNEVGQIAANSFYGAYRDPEHKGKLVVDYMYGKYLVSDAHASERKNSVLLETAAVGQMGGSIWGQASCGPTAVAILVDWQKGLSWNKDDLILYSEKNRLNDQGSLRGGGGMTAPKLQSLISGYSGGKVTASNIYTGSNTAQILKEQIDKGNRSIVVCQYTSAIVTHYSSGTHFVVVCGYEVIDGVLYFYYADPYYSYGGRSLLRVKGSVLAASMDMVTREPRCIIVVD